MRLATYKEAAKFLAMPVGSLYALVHEERVPHIRLGKRVVRFDLDELEEWVAAHRRAASASAQP